MRKTWRSRKTLETTSLELARRREVGAERLLDHHADVGLPVAVQAGLLSSSAITGKNSGAVER